jgi:hypothetical protein
MSTATVLSLARRPWQPFSEPWVPPCDGRTSGSLTARARSRDEDCASTDRIAVFSPSSPLEACASREERTLVPRSRASAHRAFQTRCRWRASATSRLRARRRLTDFCNTNRRTGTTPSCRSSPCDRGQDPSCLAHAFSPPCESDPAAREVSNRVSLRRGVTPSRLLAEDGDAKAERLRAKATSAFGARGPLLDSLLVHPLS